MKKYLLLSDAILDGSRLSEQGFGLMVNSQGHTCALGAASLAITGHGSNDGLILCRYFEPMLEARSACPVEPCLYWQTADRIQEIGYLITHLNDDHRWTRERIAAFVATIEERLGLCEIIGDESPVEQEQTDVVVADSVAAL